MQCGLQSLGEKWQLLTQHQPAGRGGGEELSELGGSENSANTCLKEGQEALEQLLLPLWAVSGREGGGGARKPSLSPSQLA